MHLLVIYAFPQIVHPANIDHSAPFSHLLENTPALSSALECPFPKPHPHVHSLQALSITLISPAFYLRPLVP